MSSFLRLKESRVDTVVHRLPQIDQWCRLRELIWRKVFASIERVLEMRRELGLQSLRGVGADDAEAHCRRENTTAGHLEKKCLRHPALHPNHAADRAEQRRVVHRQLLLPCVCAQPDHRWKRALRGHEKRDSLNPAGAIDDGAAEKRVAERVEIGEIRRSL